jgi:hypothetical protein
MKKEYFLFLFTFIFLLSWVIVEKHAKDIRRQAEDNWTIAEIRKARKKVWDENTPLISFKYEDRRDTNNIKIMSFSCSLDELKNMNTSQKTDFLLATKLWEYAVYITDTTLYQEICEYIFYLFKESKIRGKNE